jgi:hypothetical protein
MKAFYFSPAIGSKRDRNFTKRVHSRQTRMRQVASVAGQVMLGRIHSYRQSNGRLAWLVAGAAVVVILSLPNPASAQNGPPSNVMNAGNAPNKKGQTQRQSTDLIDLRDKTETALQVSVPKSNATPGLMTSADVICLAGCDGPTGKVVFHGAAPKVQPAAAREDAKPRATIATARVTNPIPPEAVDINPNAGVITCLAGCYGDQPRQIAVLASSPTRTAAALPPTVLMAHISEPRPVTPTALTQAPAQIAAVTKSKRIKMKSAYVPHKRGKAITTRVAKKKAPAKAVVVQQAPTQQPSLPAQPVIATAIVKPEAPAVAAITTVAAAPKPVAKKIARQPMSQASNDWFNRINNQRKNPPAPTTTE